MNRQDWGGDFRDGFLGNVEHQLGGKQWLKMGPEMTGRGITRGLREVLEPLLKEIESLNERIQEYVVRMEKIAKESYPQVELLKQVKGVGTQIALTYVLSWTIRIASQRVARSAVFCGCALGAGTSFDSLGRSANWDAT
jgi:hypothetical protein